MFSGSGHQAGTRRLSARMTPSSHLGSRKGNFNSGLPETSAWVGDTVTLLRYGTRLFLPPRLAYERRARSGVANDIHRHHRLVAKSNLPWGVCVCIVLLWESILVFFCLEVSICFLFEKS